MITDEAIDTILEKILEFIHRIHTKFIHAIETYPINEIFNFYSQRWSECVFSDSVFMDEFTNSLDDEANIYE